MSRLQVIQIGVGGRGRAFLQAMKNNELFEHAAFVDLNEAAFEKGRETVPMHPDKCFTDLAQAFKQVAADAAFVITPPPLHAEQCHAALDAGLHVLVEKPFTKTLADAQSVVDKADACNLRVVVSQNRRYTGAARKARELLESGKFGKVCAGTLAKAGYRGGVHHSGEDTHSYLWERGVHDIDTLLHWVEPRKARRVCAKSFNPPFSPYRGGASVYGWIEFDDGAVFALTLSFMTHSKANACVLDCEQASIVINSKLSVQRVKQDPEIVEIGKHEYPDSVQGVLQAFHAYITDGTEPPVSGRNNCETIKLIEALGRSSDENRVIELAGQP